LGARPFDFAVLGTLMKTAMKNEPVIRKEKVLGKRQSHNRNLCSRQIPRQVRPQLAVLVPIAALLLPLLTAASHSRGQASILPISLDQTSMILLEVAPCRDNCASNILAPSTT
jgi:hypothetical protein